MSEHLQCIKNNVTVFKLKGQLQKVCAIYENSKILIVK